MEINNASLPNFSRRKELTGCRKNSQNENLENSSSSGAHTNSREGGAGSRNAYRILVVELEESRELRTSGVLRSE
jgi:hypothetical protein